MKCNMDASQHDMGGGLETTFLFGFSLSRITSIVRDTVTHVALTNQPNSY